MRSSVTVTARARTQTGTLAPGRRILPLLNFLATATAGLLLSSCAEQGSGTEAASSSDRGVTYEHTRISSVPWSFHLVKVDRTEPSLSLHSALARSTVLGLSGVSEQAMSFPASLGTALAAVNGDFYQRENSPYAGDPRGLQIVEGEVVSAATGGNVFWVDATGEPHASNVISGFTVTLPDGSALPFGLNEERSPRGAVLYTPTLGRATRNHGPGLDLLLEQSGDSPWLPLKVGQIYSAKVREARTTKSTPLQPGLMLLSLDQTLVGKLPENPVGVVLKISTETTPSLKGALTALGGGPVLARRGKALPIKRPENQDLVDYSVNSMFQRHPRAVLGWSDSHFYIGEVDGRQRGLSVGMTLDELGAYMVKAGCDTAMSLDGGGSATFWYKGRVVNSPCDGTERPVANSLLVVRNTRPAGSTSPTAAAAGNANTPPGTNTLQTAP